ncbi:uncharacterized protein N7525_011513 [Penicillium rubens]|uniref:uncharacterized protein n=1 Tax=Penicillium rubens TaxID=1108849 RepID=UPI002A59A7B0|nr:uncharacterized protein N7525_011513 [Penicillium rubens]KAJ5822229.1 hypothetical protein N7525_011513 [Penicillium rubens]
MRLSPIEISLSANIKHSISSEIRLSPIKISLSASVISSNTSLLYIDAKDIILYLKTIFINLN